MQLRRTVLAVILVAATVASAPTVVAQGKFGTAAEARAMLERAVAALKANEAAAIERFNKADGGFRDRDLYLFCFRMKDGRVVAHLLRDQIDLDVRSVKDANGRTFGADLYNSAKDNTIAEVSYMFPRPGSKQPEQKVSFVTRVGGTGCGVGYYK